MPVFPNGTWFYWNSFQGPAANAGFDINQSGYGETVTAMENVRSTPWAVANLNQYSVSSQIGGRQPYRRTYQATVYSEQDYGALRANVGTQGVLRTAREGEDGPGQGQAAILTGLRRGNYQYPAWPHSGDGFRDIQTIILDFVMLQ